MRVSYAVIVSVMLPLTLATCVGQSGNVQTVKLKTVHGRLTLSSSSLSIPAIANPGSIRWVGPRKLEFSVEFLYANPCDPRTSRLEKNPAVCNLIPNKGGTYAFRIVPKKPGVSSIIIFVRIGNCPVCDIKPGGITVGIGCDRDKASAVSPELSVSRTSSVSWAALGTGTPHWTVTFDANGPCGGNSIDSEHPTCTVDGKDGEYTYKLTLEECSNSGTGKLTVKYR